jgi:hypothetical protein
MARTELLFWYGDDHEELIGRFQSRTEVLQGYSMVKASGNGQKKFRLLKTVSDNHTVQGRVVLVPTEELETLDREMAMQHKMRQEVDLPIGIKAWVYM